MGVFFRITSRAVSIQGARKRRQSYSRSELACQPCAAVAGHEDPGRPSRWRADRAARGAKGVDPFVAPLQAGREALTFSRHTLRKRFRTACRVSGKERLKHLTIHHGRHSFISRALACERTLADVRDAAGHSDVTITSGYLHVAVEENGVGALFG
jgi:integrase